MELARAVARQGHSKAAPFRGIALMRRWSPLRPGDRVEIIAPASRESDQALAALKTLLTSWGLHCVIDAAIWGKDLLCANTDAYRFSALKRALQDPTIKAIICARGGYGCMRLMPLLQTLSPPDHCKWWVGMSDITACNLYFQQHWQWPVLHGALSPERYDERSLAQVKALLFGEITQITFQGRALNQAADALDLQNSTVIGGNLTLVQASIGTSWQLKGQDKILFLEEVGERGYRVDRMLTHLAQAGIFDGVKALVFGDFLSGEEPNGRSLVQPVLQRFAESLSLPVVQIEGVGHGRRNYPLPLGTRASLQSEGEITLATQSLTQSDF